MHSHSQNGDTPAANTPLTDAGSPPAVTAPWPAGYPWVPFVVPFAVYMLAGVFEPTPDKPFDSFGVVIPYSSYPLVYTVKILLTMAAITAVWPGYRPFPLRVTPLAPLVGVVGVVLWVGICKLQLESTLLGPLGFEWLFDLGERPGFNPLDELAGQPAWAYGFLAIRFWGLAVVVPIVEEFFLRAFVMRFVVEADWWRVPFGTVTPVAIAAGTLIPMMMHPAELLAAAVWFTLVTWLMFKTRSIWDCILAHAVTNLLLGVWVVASGDWYFL